MTGAGERVLGTGSSKERSPGGTRLTTALSHHAQASAPSHSCRMGSPGLRAGLGYAGEDAQPHGDGSRPQAEWGQPSVGKAGLAGSPFHRAPSAGQSLGLRALPGFESQFQPVYCSTRPSSS